MLVHVLESASFTINGPPRPKERARVTPRGTFTPRRTREYERAVAEVGSIYIGRAWRLDGTFRVRASFVFASHRRRDVDNCLKAVLDGLNGVAWHDDSQVVMATCSKLVEPGGRERTVVTIQRVIQAEIAARRVEPVEALVGVPEPYTATGVGGVVVPLVARGRRRSGP